MNQIFMGCHLSVAGGFEKMGRDALKIGADTFAFFTRNPRGGKAKPIDRDDIEKLRVILAEENFGPLVAHAPYTLNPCSKKKEVRDFALRAMTDDMKRMALLPGNYYNFHPGSHTGQGSAAGIDMIADLLNAVITPEQETVILLETMAGKGTEVGRNFEEIQEILKRVRYQDRVGVCLDTCHVHDGGYAIAESPDEVFEAFDSIIDRKSTRLNSSH